MPSIAQQDYIIIDWEGKDATDAAKKAEVDAQLKNTYLANPLALLSVIFRNYGNAYPSNAYPILAFADNTSDVECVVFDADSLSAFTYSFSIE